MIEIAEKQGFSSPDTLLYSQKLDKVIFEYQRCTSLNSSAIERRNSPALSNF
ncbi:Spo0E family sporulation regulatory protein-aspartic acid phosphatase [Bacillus idriensis]|uniref:Spo0E family sporulation regulatory protein-aspartic acid phosphatase n=2 Tax=Metabacillus idriensis TaxID=324768 RepID=A0A6I2M9E4_9BACI|nr:Spo0E family sporulation regulatory protein-aspartic acid phosphatase [Metabacillus idriensis]